MKWEDLRQSDNVEDRRGASPGLGGFGGGGVIRTGGLGIGGLLVLLLVSYLFGVDPLSLLAPDQGASDAGYGAPSGPAPSANDPAVQFVRHILGDTEDTWSAIFARGNARYPAPTLVLFTDEVDSACGLSSAAVGPFYCPGDQKVYLDLSFFRELAQRFGAPGDFAQAYVIAHEVGHHVQNLLGALASGGGLSRLQANAQSVRQELQADCLAGVWGHSAASRGVLDPGDVEEGLNAAAAVGDDRLQRQAQGRVVPESFTHGSSADRVAAFKRGLDGGELSSCGLGR
ncbi:MAG TPA: neutral zinc metallopeptidase [Vicinamibacterales bacterium]|nr:neutral zinc metallopeptidase [Vicinamibacterales bacterium]